nr:MAG TPA: hypothetical protein [Caudoviricetes sp.]DAY73241.1 MAG TPA: hypothetical protein [Caudoviricetes sp.]
MRHTRIGSKSCFMYAGKQPRLMGCDVTTCYIKNPKECNLKRGLYL